MDRSLIDKGVLITLPFAGSFDPLSPYTSMTKASLQFHGWCAIFEPHVQNVVDAVIATGRQHLFIDYLY